MKLKDNSTQEIDTALYQLEQKLKSNIRLTDVENSNASTAKINAVDKKLTEEVKDRQSADEKLQGNINKEIADRQDADAAIENAKQDKLIAGDNIQIDGNVISATSKEYTAEAPIKVTDGKISLDTVPVTKGGTGVTTQEDINKAFINNLNVGNDNVTDGTEFVSSWASDKGFADPSGLNKPYKRQFIKVWNYINDKISSVLGLTSVKVSSYDSHLSNKDNPHSVTKSQVGLGSVVNTGDSATPVSGGTTKFTTGGAYTELNKKVDKVDGKGLSSNDFTNTYKDKLDNTDTTVTTNSSNLVTSGAVATAISTEVTNRNTAITNAINNLDVSSVGGDGKYISAISETDGKISATSTTMDTAPTTNSVKAVTSGGIKTAISTAETNAKNLANATGTLAIANGGTGATTAKDAFINLANGLSEGAGPLDTEYVIYKNTGGTHWGLYTLSTFWNYIKNKISSVLGLTKDNYGGKSAKSSFLDEYPGAGGTRPTSGNIVPKDSSEFGGMRKDVVTNSMTEGGYPVQDGHLLTMFWDNAGRYDSQLFVSSKGQQTVKVRTKANKADYGPWTDIITSNNIGSQTVATATTARTAADAGYLCKLYQLAYATQTYNVILLGKIPDPASTEAPATPSASWDIDVDFYFVRPQGHKASWCNVKAGYGYSNAWRKYGLIETFGVDSGSNYAKQFYLVTLKYNNEYYIGVRHMVDIDGSYAARVKYVNTAGNRNPSTVNNTPLVNMLKVIPYQKTTDGTILNSEIKTSIADFPNTYAPAVERNGDLLLKSGYVRIGTGDVAGSKLTIQGSTVNSNSYTDTNPKLEFKNKEGSQNISLTFTDYDAVQAPASLTLNGNQGNEYFIAPNIKATTKFIGNLTGNVSGSSGSAGKLTTARKTYVTLGTASTTETRDWSGDTTIPVDGVLQVEHGGTGCNTARAAADTLITSLPASNNVPVDTDYIISQVVNGGPFVPGYERRPVSKLWEYIKGKILQEGEDFGYNHIVYDDASLLEWANCTDGHMKKVLVKSGTYNMTKGVDFSKAGTGYVFAENGAVINSKVPIAFNAPSGKTAVHNLKVVCGPSSDNSCAFSANDVLNLILYDCEASYATNTITVDRDLFSKCTCYNCHYNFTYSSSNSSMSIKVFYQCYCYNCICKQTIAANSSSAVSFATSSYFYKECVCVSCDAELTILRNIKAATPSFSCYYNCWDRCIGCLSKINVNNSALTVYSTLYGFLRCQHMSGCKEVHTVGYSNIKGVVQCIYISSTSGINGESNTNVGNSCDIK